MKQRPASRPEPARHHNSSARVEKQPPKKAQRSLPAWYYRVATMEVLEGTAEIDPTDFDEDLSDLEEEDDDPAGECEQCDGDDSECDCMVDGEDAESERSYDGSDAGFYYEVKEQREERKLQLVEKEKKKQERMKWEKSKEDEVNAVWESLKANKKDQPTPIDWIPGQEFIIYSKDYAEFCDLPDPPTKRVDFWVADEETNFPKPASISAGQEFGVQIYCDADANCQFQLPFPLSTQGNLEPIHAVADNKYNIQLTLLSEQYLKLSVPRALFEDTHIYRLNNFQHAPSVFEFVGILRDREKEKRERKNSPPSPRGWFFHSCNRWEWL